MERSAQRFLRAIRSVDDRVGESSEAARISKSSSVGVPGNGIEEGGLVRIKC